MKYLDLKIKLLVRAVSFLSNDCKCSVLERLSGHLIDCPAPAIRKIIEELRDLDRVGDVTVCTCGTHHKIEDATKG